MRFLSEPDLVHQLASGFRVSGRNHRVVRLEPITLTIVTSGETMTRHVPLQRLVRLAIDQRDDLVLGRERFPGKSMLAAGVSTYRGKSAIAIGASHRTRNGSTVFKLGITYDSSDHVGANGGVGFQF